MLLAISIVDFDQVMSAVGCALNPVEMTEILLNLPVYRQFYII